MNLCEVPIFIYGYCGYVVTLEALDMWVIHGFLKQDYTRIFLPARINDNLETVTSPRMIRAFLEEIGNELESCNECNEFTDPG